MTAELGHFALILAFCIALMQAGLTLWGAARGWDGWMAAGRRAAGMQLGLLALAFAALTWGALSDDFSLDLIRRSSQRAKPMLYKIAGVWGGHEGSMLLWALILALFGGLFAVTSGHVAARFRARVLGVQGAIGAAVTGYAVLVSNPFTRLTDPPIEGLGMNPLLEDPGLALHPPLLYLGYVGLSLAYSLAVAALIEGRTGAGWAGLLRPWVLLAWMFLTLGIAAGAWWAYRELGWGGFWFWDPVENASLIPWLLATALLHSVLAAEKRGVLSAWTILLAILGFGAALGGTFIVRSGLLGSVHAFATDPARGIALLAILGVVLGGALALFAARAGRIDPGPGFALISRESALVFNNLLLSVGAFVVLTGTLWPLIAEAVSGRILSVGAPYFDRAVTPFAVLLGLVLPVGALLGWKHARLHRVLSGLGPALIVALIAGGLSWTGLNGTEQGGTGLGGMSRLAGALAVGLGGWIVAGAVIDLGQRARGRPGRILRLPRADHGRALGHAGFGLLIVAIGLSTAGRVETLAALRPGTQMPLGGLSVTLDAVTRRDGPNYRADVARLTLRDGPEVLARLSPERRVYPLQGLATAEAAILVSARRDIYLVLGDPQGDGSWAVRGYLRPGMLWLWGAAGMMAAGGALALSDRRGGKRRVPCACR
ncbi:heme lyase CcmF/NrfE family subunit [Paenirhodobacter enshiensis]|uniref:heme lyase CcmF/NrfE family subunit n=1 Tax=Paenirhodobacter enshiensis TaxID=1105367 RepID=UPI0035B27D86